MDRRHLQLVLRHAAATACPEPDALLLRRFAQDRDEAAFAELVRRHGRLVWALCRNLLPSEADADDAFQATFLAFARSAGSVRDASRLGPFLHGVAYRVCLKARRAAARRKKREQAAASPEATRPVADSAWDAALAAVHEEVARLPEPQRVAFVLCCLEGKGVSEAAAQLGWKLGTLSGRLTRAKDALLARLAARGIAATVGGTAAITCGAASGGVPVAVTARTAELILVGATVPRSILTLSQGVTGMAIHRTKFLAATVLLAGGLVAAVGSGWLAPAGQQPADVETVKELFAAVDANATPAPATEFCYYVPKEPPTVAQFEAAVAKYAAHFKAEFVGVARLHTHEITKFGARVVADDAKALAARQQVVEALVFKRAVPPKLNVTFLDTMPLHELVLPEGSARDWKVELIHPMVKSDPSLKAQELEAQIKQLQAQLDDIRKKSRTSAKVNKTDLGIDPKEMLTILHTLAAKRFGKDARDRLQMSAGTDVLSLEGDAEAVKWAQDVIRKLTEK